MANTIDFNVNTNAVTVLNQIDAAAENTAQGFSSAKAELRALQQQLLGMDQSSAEFQKAAARAAQLRDSIGDLSAEINANAGNAFEGLSNNIGLFGSRLMDLDLAGAGQALTGMGNAVSRIDFKTMKEEIGGLISGFFNLAKAIMANPILLLGGIIAAVVMNMDKLRKAMPGLDAAMGGLTEKMKAAAKANEASLKARQLEFDIINASTALMKEQGMSDKEILLVQKEKAKALLEQKKVTDAQNIANAKADLQRNENLKMVLKGIQEVGLAIPKLMAYVFDTIFAKTKELLSYVGVTIDTSIQAYDTIIDAQGLVLDAIFGNTAEQISAIQEMENQALLSQTQLANTIAQMGLDVKKIDEDNTKRVQTQFEKVESIGMKRIALNEKVVNNIISQEDKLKKVQEKNAKELAEKQRLQMLQRLEIASSGLDALSALNEAFTKRGEKQSKRQFQIQKALNLASAVVDTYGGINRALNDKTMPSTTARIVQAAIVGAMGLANVLKISKTQYEGNQSISGVSMGTGGSGGEGGTTAPSPANFDFLNQQPNQQPPLQAYVVSTQVSSNLEAQQLINNQARLGG
jgi:hypothetical protein